MLMSSMHHTESSGHRLREAFTRLVVEPAIRRNIRLAEALVMEYRYTCTSQTVQEGKIRDVVSVLERRGARTGKLGNGGLPTSPPLTHRVRCG